MKEQHTFTSEGKRRLVEGAKKSGSLAKERSNSRRKEYENSPVLCLGCQKNIPYEKRFNKFCGRSCAASINNSLFPKRGLPARFCKQCQKDLIGKHKSAVYCSQNCQIKFVYETNIKKWLSGEIPGGTDTSGPSDWVRRFLIEAQEGGCAICSLREWRGLPIGLILDHIDGNSYDHRRENLRMVCANCDMQLPTYKAKNRGNGRHVRRERYAAGLSY